MFVVLSMFLERGHEKGVFERFCSRREPTAEIMIARSLPSFLCFYVMKAPT